MPRHCKQCFMTWFPFRSLIRSRKPGSRAAKTNDICLLSFKVSINFCTTRVLTQQYQFNEENELEVKDTTNKRAWIMEDYPCVFKVIRVRLEGNQQTGNLAEAFGIHPKLKYINLSSNKLHGEVLAKWAQCHNLASLNLSNNRISGSIPPELGLAARLQLLDLSSNNLKGKIPGERFQRNWQAWNCSNLC